METLETNKWEDKNVFVTGGTGLAGSWLTEELLKRKANVHVLVMEKIPRSKFFIDKFDEKTTIIHGILQDYHLMERVFNEYEIDTVFHLGAQPIVTIASRNPLSTFDSNIKGTWTLLEAARRNDHVKGIIIASSDKAYGSSDVLPYTEDMDLKGEFPYEVSKSCTDLIARAYHKTYGLPVAISRCANFYGGGDLNFNRIIPGTIKAVLKNQQPVIRSDGKYVRDFIYIKDVINSYLALAGNIHKNNVKGEAFNFSTEEKNEVLTIVNTILELMNSNLKPVILNQPLNEIREQTLDARKAREILNWKHEYNLNEGLKETIEWYEKHLFFT